MQLGQIRDFIKDTIQDAGWHFIEGKLEDIDKYVDIDQKKVLFTWETTSGEWVSKGAVHSVIFYFCDFLRIDEMEDRYKNNSYKTDKFDLIVDQMQTVFNTMFDQTTSNLVPIDSYEFRYFEERFQENLSVVTATVNFHVMDFYCSNPYAS